MSLITININSYNINLLDNDWVGSSIINGVLWEPHITFFLERNLNKDSVLVDVGSNYGWHSIMSSKLCKTIYSFEPQSYMFNIQKENITQNGIKNIRIFNYGIGDRDKYLNMSPINYEDNVNIGDLSIGDGGEKIEIKTLDSLNLGYIDFIKIDVQGYEKFVLNGCSGIIKNHKPILIIEVEDHQLRKFNYGADDLFKFIYGMGYHIYLLDYHYPSDHVCVHKDKLHEFLSKNYEWVKPLTKSNNLNHNLENGITEKIIYN